MKAAVLLLAVWSWEAAAAPLPKLTPPDMREARWTAGFWAERFELVRRTTLPVIWKALNDPANGASYRNFLRVIGEEQSPAARTDWSDGDVYKYVEAVADVYAHTKDPALDRHLDEMIAVIARAQEPDGYLSTPVKLKGYQRWTNLSHHELYNHGHLMTAACVHHRATGKRNFLAVATRAADYLYTVFQPRPRELAHFGFNPSNIMGLVDLYRATGNRKYLELAGIFVDMRGSAPGGADLNQTRVPLRQESEAVGHAVTACYLYAGAADVYAETGEPALLAALERIWTDAATKKAYVTGAVGNLYHGSSRHRQPTHEAFGLGYELPHRLGYNETCANIAFAMWNWRMLGLTGEAKYADMMELVLYNSMLSGMGVEGKDFFYNNPLRRDADELPLVMRPDPILRSPTLICYCCPPNLARTIAGLSGWAYGKSAGALWVHLYGSNTLDTRLAGGRVRLTQTSAYPWDGQVTLEMLETPGTEFSMRWRIPGWASGATLRVNREAARPVAAGQYAELRRKWAAGDRIELRLPLEARLVVANPYVESTRNQVAVMRGPLVYALESPDLPAGVRLTQIALPADARWNPRHEPSLLGGVTVLQTRARVLEEGDWTGKLYQTLRPAPPRWTPVRLIPYYAWANRGVSHMAVWLPVLR